MKRGLIESLVVLILIVICFLLQTTVFKHLALADVVPNLLLILTVSIAYIRGQKAGMLCGFVSGLVIDMIYCDVIGIHALLLLLLGFLDGFVHFVYDEEDFTLPVVMTALSDFIFSFFYYVMSFAFRSRLDLGYYMQRVIIPELVYTLLISIFMYRLIQKILRIFEPKTME